MSNPHANAFEQASPMLMGLAYRMLGSRADAEDAVQDTFIKWQNADRATIKQMLHTAALRHGVNPGLVMGLAWWESGWNESAMN